MMDGPGDKLLYLISARGSISWMAFKEAFDYLWLQSAGPAGMFDDDAVRYARLDTVRVFDSLAHCEFDFDSRMVHAAPPVLARLPQPGSPRAVLAGSRSPDTLSRLRSIAPSHSAEVVVTAHAGSNSFSPLAASVKATSTGDLYGIADTLGIEFPAAPPALTLLNLSPSLAEYLAQLSWSAAPDLTWLRRDFDLKQLVFVHPDASAHSIRLSEYTHPLRRSQRHYLWRNGSRALVDRDWGRWILLASLGLDVLSYDPACCQLSVPSRMPLPGYLGRSLVLCSGLLPTTVAAANGRDDAVSRRTVFKAVPPQASQLVAAKLGQKLIVTLRGGQDGLLP